MLVFRGGGEFRAYSRDWALVVARRLVEASGAESFILAPFEDQIEDDADILN